MGNSFHLFFLLYLKTDYEILHSFYVLLKGRKEGSKAKLKIQHVWGWLIPMFLALCKREAEES